MEELKKYDNITGLEIDDYSIEFYINIDFFGIKQVCLNFDDYDISIESEKIKVLYLIDNILKEIPKLAKNIFKEIKQYSKKQYDKDITEKDFLEGNIEIMVINFSSDWTRDTFCIELNSTFEEEHGIGIVIKDKKIKKIGYADICFDSGL